LRRHHDYAGITPGPGRQQYFRKRPRRDRGSVL